MGKVLTVTVWNEFRHEIFEEEPASKIYPNGIHKAIASHLEKQPDLKIRTATLDEPEHGLTDEVLDDTEVLIWWGHCAHDEVSDHIVEKLHQKVLQGMGLIVLHSGHFSKNFQAPDGNRLQSKMAGGSEKERVWVIDPSHPIAQGIDPYFEIPETEMYGEFFDVPPPEALVFVSWYQGGEVFRSGCCWTRGRGKIFYFSPGHEDYPIYHNPKVLKVIENAVRWAAPADTIKLVFGKSEPLEKL